jgi:hypothetical protein
MFEGFVQMLYSKYLIAESTLTITYMSGQLGHHTRTKPDDQYQQLEAKVYSHRLGGNLLAIRILHQRGSYKVESYRRLCLTTKSYGLYCNISTAEIFPPCRSQLPVSHSRPMSERASEQHTVIPSPCTCRSRKLKVIYDVRRKAGNPLVLELEVAKNPEGFS